MTKSQAFHAMAQLTADSDAVNEAIAHLIHRGNANGLSPQVLLGFLSRKFVHQLNGLAHIVMSVDEHEDEAVEPIVFQLPSQN
jgi:hypothetical protein